jgi:Ca2+-binding EF-hand superfamily protein
MNKKKVIAAVALVALAGAAATVAAQGHREWRRGGFDPDTFHGGGMGLGMGPGTGRGDGRGDGMGDERGRDMFGRGMFGRELTKDAFDARLRERFARLDKNSDGILDSAEIEASTTERMGGMRGRAAGGPGGQADPGMNAQPGAQQMLRRLGADKDSRLSKQAFLDRVKARFAEADLNNDGRITDDDLPPMMRGRGLITTDNIKTSRLPMLRFLRDVEVKDGAITLDAVLASATKQFERMDRNKDGVVEPSDFAAMRKEMADYQVKRFVHRYGGDKDGKVTREQFFAKEGQRFAEADSNGDGVISRDEMGGRPGFGQRMRERFMGRRDGAPRDGAPMGGPGGPGGVPPPKQ